MKQPWSEQLIARGRRFTALAVSISPCRNTELFLLITVSGSGKSCCSSALGEPPGEAYSFPSFFTPWMHTWPWPGMQRLQLHTVVLSTVDFLLNTSTFLKIVKDNVGHLLKIITTLTIVHLIAH